MTTEVWCRNPKSYIREVLEVRQSLTVWDMGFLIKNSLDVVKFCDLYYPQDMHWRALVVGDYDQGAAEVSRGGSTEKPDAVYPVWAYGGDWNILEELVENPVGEDVDACSDKSVPRRERPVLGQEHRVVITDIPNVSSGPGRKFVRLLHELQLDYPECIIHVHGLYSYRVMFGFSFRSVDVDSRTRASKGDVEMPNGKCVRFEQMVKHPQWANLLGMKPVDLQIPRNRCIYNIKSALWAAKNFEKNVPFKTRGEYTPDTVAADSAVVTPETKAHKLPKGKPGDKFICDTCSLADQCKFYRVGAVCSVSDSEPKTLAEFFNTRDSDAIISGLGALLGKQADRLERGLEDEQYGEELDSEVSKLINSLFGNGVKLAKLTNPELAGGTKVGVFVNGGHGSSVAVGGSASQLTAAIVNELEAKGISREDITPEMIGEVLNPNSKTMPAIEAHAVTDERS